MSEERPDFMTPKSGEPRGRPQRTDGGRGETKLAEIVRQSTPKTPEMVPDNLISDADT